MDTDHFRTMIADVHAWLNSDQGKAEVQARSNNSKVMLAMSGSAVVEPVAQEVPKLRLPSLQRQLAGQNRIYDAAEGKDAIGSQGGNGLDNNDGHDFGGDAHAGEGEPSTKRIRHKGASKGKANAGFAPNNTVADTPMSHSQASFPVAAAIAQINVSTGLAKVTVILPAAGALAGERLIIAAPRVLNEFMQAKLANMNVDQQTRQLTLPVPFIITPNAVRF